MNIYTIFTFIFFLSITQSVKSQDTIFIEKADIAGRWVETKRIEGGNEKIIEMYADTYIFRDNMVFHKGEASEGVILFNITGRYKIEGNLVIVSYRDYIQKGASKQKAKELVFKVLSILKNEMVVSVRNRDYEYKMVLKKQNI